MTYEVDGEAGGPLSDDELDRIIRRLESAAAEGTDTKVVEQPTETGWMRTVESRAKNQHGLFRMAAQMLRSARGASAGDLFGSMGGPDAIQSLFESRERVIRSTGGARVQETKSDPFETQTARPQAYSVTLSGPGTVVTVIGLAAIGGYTVFMWLAGLLSR